MTPFGPPIVPVVFLKGICHSIGCEVYRVTEDEAENVEERAEREMGG